MIFMIHLYIVFQQVKDYKALNMQSHFNMKKKKIKKI